MCLKLPRKVGHWGGYHIYYIHIYMYEQCLKFKGFRGSLSKTGGGDGVTGPIQPPIRASQRARPHRQIHGRHVLRAKTMDGAPGHTLPHKLLSSACFCFLRSLRLLGCNSGLHN